jgi:pimeloyl-ACP methyl ester carboxylesterase
LALLCTGLLSFSLVGCAWLDAEQRRIALRPTPGVPAEFAAGSQGERDNFKPGDERWLVPVPGADGATNQLALWWLPQVDPQAPTLLYLHGTLRSLYGNLSKINALREAGFAILAVDYRGWGESTALVPSEDTITADAAVAWAEMQRRQPLPGRRVVFGHSMGGAVAVRLASGLKGGNDYAALVLESTFTRLPDVADMAGFWGHVGATLTTLDFNSLARISRVDAPLLMLHGTLDKTVPVELGRRLRDAAPAGVTWVEVPQGSHSQLHTEAAALYQQTFRNLIARLPPP